MSDREHLLLDLNDLIEDLTVRVLVDERYVWSPRREGLRHRAGGVWRDWTGRLPARENRRVKRRDPALLDQLADRTGDPFATSGSHEPVTGSKPGSRPPFDLDPLATIEKLAADAATARALLAAEAGKPEPKPANLGADLAAIRSLATHPAITTLLLRAVVTDLRSAVNSALIHTGYNAPMIELGFVCGGCGGTMITRADASGDVVCVGGDGVDAPWAVAGCRASWPRATWAELLTG